MSLGTARRRLSVVDSRLRVQSVSQTSSSQRQSHAVACALKREFMQGQRTLSLLVTGLAVIVVPARAQAPPVPDDIRTRRIVYTVAGMDRVSVQRDLAFRAADGQELKM